MPDLLYDRLAIKKALESQFVTRIPEDDGLWLTLAGVELVIRATWEQNVAVVAEQLNERIEAFQEALDEASQRKRDETRAEVMQLMLALRLQLREEKDLASKELRTTTDGWQDSIRDMQAVAEQIVKPVQGNKWLNVLLGLMLASGLILAGMVLGRLRWV